MTIVSKEFTRITYVCNACGESAPSFEIKPHEFAGLPSGWRAIGGKLPRHFCSSCCDRCWSPGQLTVREVIDAFVTLDRMEDAEVGTLQLRSKVA